MPELPEVETIVRQLAPLLVGRRVRRFEVFDPLLELSDPERLAGRGIVAVERLGKRIVIRFSETRGGGPLWGAIHLRMTGRLLWADAAAKLAADPPPGPLRARWHLDRGCLLFHDTRRFGTICIMENLEEAAAEGLDPTSAAFDGAALHALVRGAKQPIKPWLLRQDRLAGIGNIYASEALHAAAIHPARSAGSLSRAECTRLAEGLHDVLMRAIEAGGTTFSDFQNARGDVGNYQKNLRVYDHEGDPCVRCGRPIERIVQAQRATYFCSGCQRRGKASSTATTTTTTAKATTMKSLFR